MGGGGANFEATLYMAAANYCNKYYLYVKSLKPLYVWLFKFRHDIYR